MKRQSFFNSSCSIMANAVRVTMAMARHSYRCRNILAAFIAAKIVYMPPRIALSPSFHDCIICGFSLLGPFAAWGRFLKEMPCKGHPSAPFVPSDFPCEGTAWDSTAWLLRHPASLFLLSEKSRCFSFCVAFIVPLIWVAHLVLKGRSFQQSHRMLYLSLIRVLPKVANAVRMLISGRPSATLLWHQATGFEKCANTVWPHACISPRCMPCMLVPPLSVQ